MAGLSEKINNILNDIDNNIKDQKEAEYVKSKVMELTTTFIEYMDNIVGLQSNQDMMEKKIKKIQKKISQIEEDIYMDLDDECDCDDECSGDCECGCDDEGCEFEISCPYCGDAFIIDESSQNENEIECPNCKNIIELDWDEPAGCSGECSHCASGCYEDSDDSKEAIDSALAEDGEEYNTSGDSANINNQNGKNNNSNNNQGQNGNQTNNGQLNGNSSNGKENSEGTDQKNEDDM